MEKCRRRLLQRGVEQVCCGLVLGRGLWRSVVEKCWREVLHKSLLDKCWRRVL